MPIRMVQDDPNSQEEYIQEDNQQAQTGGGGGFNFGSILFFIPVIKWLFGRPKLLMLAAALVAVYFFVVKPMFNGSTGSGPNRTTGANFDAKKYDSTEVFEALDNSALANNALPERVSLEKFAPQRLNQGEQGSCVAWSSAYAARTIMESASTGVDPNSIAFSPSYLYNQIHLPDCQGALLPDAMRLMLYKGAVPLKFCPYNENNCTAQPGEQLNTMAASYKTRGFQRLTKNGDDHTVDFLAIKQNLAAGAPVVIGMMVPKSFMQNMMGNKVWHPTRSDDPNYGTMGGHAMCVMGYDDNIEGGAFQVMNSWGQDWGDRGFGWIRYPDFMKFNKEAYGLYPLVAKGSAATKNFACSVGCAIDGKNIIPITSKGNGVFETSSKIPKGTKFKMYVKNELECYTYIFGQETNNTSFVLFPYTVKHSPFCGITGVRLFPKDYSMQVDNVGTKDYMAMVVTKQAIDYNALNKKITASPGADYATKVRNAVGAMGLQNVQFTTDGKFMQFRASAPTENKAVVCILEVNK
jgi:Papain family cysteine protease